MGNQCLLVNNGSPETIMVKFEHCSLFEFELEIHKTFYTIPISTCDFPLELANLIVKMAQLVKIDKI